MHFQPYRVSGATRHWLQLWVPLLMVPACFALASMRVDIAAVAVTLTFGLPLGIWFAFHVNTPGDFRAGAARGLRFAARVCLTILGIIGLFIFSPLLALAAIAAYVVTVGLVTVWGGTDARATTEPTHETSSAISEEPEPHTSVIVTLEKVREMTDAELCHAWRRSFVALERARGVHLRALLVQTRQLLLDEFEKRHPEGLRTWLSSGARAAGGPDRFIGRSDSGHPEAA